MANAGMLGASARTTSSDMEDGAYFGATMANRWIILDLGQPGGLAVSNGLRYRI